MFSDRGDDNDENDDDDEGESEEGNLQSCCLCMRVCVYVCFVGERHCKPNCHKYDLYWVLIQCFTFLDELASDEDEINEDDVQYIEGLAQKVRFRF